MSEPLKVLMMGGRRCGKTSALASMFDQMINGEVKNYLTVADRTKIETKGFETQDSLGGKTLELENMLETNKGNSNIFLVDKGPTSNFWLYNLHLQIPGKRREMDIEFRDSAGEFFEAAGIHAAETSEYIQNCDVFVIVIDTPYLMGPVEESTMDLCPESINLGTNRVMDIQNFLTNINDNDGKDAKMVVFVPLKCEKWVKEKRINEVTARIKTVYATCIQNLMAYSKMSISIIPMETSGNILFSEMKKAYYFHDETGKFSNLYPKNRPGDVRCCLIDDETVRLENGEHELCADKCQIDSESVINGTNLTRPYAWYHINPADSSSAPHNCDQLPLHIIRFMLSKLYDAETRKSGDFFGWFSDLIRRIRQIFGSMDPNELQGIISSMQRNGVIKDSGYGIEILKKI